MKNSKKYHPKLVSLLKNHNMLSENGNLKIEDDHDVELLIEEINQQMNAQEIQNQETKNELEKLEVILNATPCTISWIDRNLKYEGANKALSDLCGIKINDFKGHDVGFYTNQKYFTNFAKTLFSSNLSTVYGELETEINQEVKRFWLSGTKFNNNEQAILIGVDITELRNLENYISFNEKLSSLGEMVTGIIHEVNNPLAVINMNADWIKEHCHEEKILEHTEKIKMTSHKINKIIKGVRNFVRHEEQDPFDNIYLKSIIDDAITICNGQLKSNNIKISISNKGVHTKVFCNYTQIFQVFVNMLTNAIDALEGSESPWIKIEVEELETIVRINIINSGAKIDKDINEKIFKPFFTTKEMGSGTGLGLSISNKIIKEHHGKISLNNNHPNTCFQIELPSINTIKIAA